jgi:hypothetical protein
LSPFAAVVVAVIDLVLIDLKKIVVVVVFAAAIFELVHFAAFALVFAALEI